MDWTARTHPSSLWTVKVRFHSLDIEGAPATWRQWKKILIFWRQGWLVFPGGSHTGKLSYTSISVLDSWCFHTLREASWELTAWSDLCHGEVPKSSSPDCHRGWVAVPPPRVVVAPCSTHIRVPVLGQSPPTRHNNLKHSTGQALKTLSTLCPFNTIRVLLVHPVSLSLCSQPSSFTFSLGVPHKALNTFHPFVLWTPWPGPLPVCQVLAPRVPPSVCLHCLWLLSIPPWLHLPPRRPQIPVFFSCSGFYWDFT